MDIFTVLFYQPIYNVMVVLYRLFGENLGLSIIMIAIISRVITLPITIRQRKFAKQSRELNDKSEAIKKKYKNNKEKQQEELMKLQTEYLPGQLGGCLPMILQFIFLINIYNVIKSIIIDGIVSFAEVAYSFVPVFADGYQVDTMFLGINLGKSASDIVTQSGGFTTEAIPYIALILLVGVLQYSSTKILSAMRKQDMPEKKEEKKKKDGEEPADFTEIMQQSTKQAMLIMPIMFMFASYSFPAGLSLYWTVQSGFVIIQQLIIDRFFSNLEGDENKDKKNKNSKKKK